jgi:DNA-binding winged helix-turn-helix (wHTH) protein
MRLTFEDCTLDLRARQLERAGQAVPLEPKMYELLEALIKRRGTVLTNNELDEILWPEVYVARTSLTRLVSELRAVLGDSPRDSRIIRTVYKTGYCFCAEVVGVAAAAMPAPALVELVWNRQTLPLPDGEHIAGRDADCSVVIDATTVSRRHARITVLGRKATIEDLESTNGTRVNGARIQAPAALTAGSEVILGKEVLRVRMRDPAALTVRVDSPTTSTPKVQRR